MQNQIRKLLNWLLLGTLVLIILVGLGLFASSSTSAEIRRLEEAPGQMVYQSTGTECWAVQSSAIVAAISSRNSSEVDVTDRPRRGDSPISFTLINSGMANGF